MAFKRLLVPVDFSEASWSALRFATEVAKRLDGSVDVLHVQEPLSSGLADMRVLKTPNRTLADVIRARAEHELEAIANRARELGFDNLTSRKVVGNAASAIEKAASDEPYDAVVLGRANKHRFHLGSVGARVVRHANCPVLSVPEDYEALPFSSGTILAPIDIHEGAAHATATAHALSTDVEAKLTLLHVWAPPHYAAPDTTVIENGSTETTTVADVVSGDVAANVKAIKAELGLSEEQTAHWTIHTEFGQPAYSICKYAREQSADLILLASHRRHGISRIVWGSVAENVMRLAPCPVLTYSMNTDKKPIADLSALTQIGI